MGKKNMMGMMGMGMSMMNAPMMSSPMMSQRMMSQRMMGLMKIQEDKKPSLMMALKDALADGKLTMMERMELKKQYPMAEASGKLDMQVMMALEKINKVQSPVVMARPMKPSLMKAIKEALSDGKLTMMERMELKMQFPMAAESGKLDNKIMMIAEKKELMGVLMDAEKSDTPIMMMMMMREISEGTKILQSKEGTEADRKFAATNAFRKKVGLPPITREKFEADAAADAERKARRAMRTMMQNMGIKMAIKDALADGKLTMMEKMELKKEFPKAAKSGQLDKKIMMVQMMLEPIKMDAKPVPMMATGIMMAIKDALADGKLTMMEKMELKMQFPLAAESGKLEKKVMMALKKINEVQQPAKKAKPMKPSLMKAIEKALDDGKLTMMELKKLEMMYPMAAESGKLDQKIMMAQMMLDPIKDKKAVEPNPPMMKMGLNMAIKDALADGKLTMMEKMELKMQFPMAAESGKLDEKIMMVQMMLDPIKDKKAVEPNPPMMKMGLNMAIKDALSDGKLTMMEKMELKMQFPMAAESGKLDEKIMMAQMMLDSIKMDAVKSEVKKESEPASPMMKMGLNMAIKDALSDGKLTMMEKMELKMQFPMAAESGKLDQKIDKFTDKTSMDLKTDTSDSKDNNQTVKDADSSDSSENKGKDKDGKDKIIDGKDRGGGKIIFDGRIDSGVNKGDKGPHHGLPKIDYDASIDNYKPERLDFVKKDGTFKKPKLKRKDYSADTFRSEAFKSELDSRGLTGDRRGGTVTHFKDSTGTLKKIPTDASGIPKALTSDGKGGFKDLGGPPTLSTERDLFGDLDETRQSKLATIKSIVDNPQPGATKMAISMRKSKGLSILMDAGFTQTRTRMKPLLMTPASNSRSTRLNIRL